MTILNGLIVMTPSTVDVAGSGSETATINANGSVSFSACTSVSLNDVFTASYDNYMITFRQSSTILTNNVARLRNSGVDDTGSNYTYEELVVNGTSVTAARTTQAQTIFSNIATELSGDTVFIFGPYLTQETAWRNISGNPQSGGLFLEVAGTHGLTNSYDGITFYPASGEIEGVVTVHGFNQ